MRERRAGNRHWRSRRLLPFVLIAVMSASGCAQPDELTALPLAAHASERSQPTVSERPSVAGTAPEGWSAEAPASSDVSSETPADVPRVPPAAATTTSPAAPVGLRIPAIDLDADLMELGLQADGTLEVPSNGFPAGWYRGSPSPGELGPAVIAGHVDWDGQPGVFYNLRDLSPGDAILVSRQDGSLVRFEITRVERFAKSEFPTQQVYGDLDHAGLRLITCGGAFNPHVRSYDDNLIVFAERV